MKNDILIKIENLENEIESALKRMDFVEISELSATMEKEVTDLTDSFLSKTKITRKDVEILEYIKSLMSSFEKKTKEKFSDFTGKTSAQKKMHEAYKKYGL